MAGLTFDFLIDRLKGKVACMRVSGYVKRRNRKGLYKVRRYLRASNGFQSPVRPVPAKESTPLQAESGVAESGV